MLGSIVFAVATAFLASVTSTVAGSVQLQPPWNPERADVLRGAYGRYRANNELLSYDLDIRVIPFKREIVGKNTIRFRMVKGGSRIQLDLADGLKVEKILFGQEKLRYSRDAGAVFVAFPRALLASQTYSVEFYYSGHPRAYDDSEGVRFGKDARGNDWICSSCENSGAGVWWPNKDQWRNRVQNMRLSVAIPNDLVDVSNGTFLGKTDVGHGYTRWDWAVHYPIDNYGVCLNIGKYVHFSDRLNGLRLDYWVLPQNLDKAKAQFAQVKGMLRAYQHYFGEYPFPKDGYKLVEVPYAGMEHQSAIAYGNGFANGYGGSDWTGVGISPKFDFIIIHESAHEWFGNSIAAADRSDMWIHEGWATYLEGLYVEYRFGKADGLTYLNGLKSHIKNLWPVVAPRDVNAEPPEDQYFKGALMLNTLRSVVGDDRRWFRLIHDFYQHFKYHTILTEDVIGYFNRWLGQDLTPIFNQYLRHRKPPTLELKFGRGSVAYRWMADEPRFAMPVKVGAKNRLLTVRPTLTWQKMKTAIPEADFQVGTDLFYVDVAKG